LQAAIEGEDELDEAFFEEFLLFLKGSVSNTTELLQVKRDLGRTRYAEEVRRQRRAVKNVQLQAGGVLTVEQGRAMAKKREENDLVKAQRIVDAAKDALLRKYKRMGEEVAGRARGWRWRGKLDPCEVNTLYSKTSDGLQRDGEVKWLKRGF